MGETHSVFSMLLGKIEASKARQERERERSATRVVPRVCTAVFNKHTHTYTWRDREREGAKK